ncbi:hypothetical protein ACFQUU_08540 [Herbaspirillum sp. GCM10030257]|uniref:hypothetical protein n=1 Tax=Herbaspirillum sp. GCM10030257 TaxID=3273393 RepID=UPI003607E91F
MNASINENKSSQPLFNEQADLREQFEAWHAKKYISSEELEWDGDGYADFDHNCAWKAYQAAALARESAPVEQAELVAAQRAPRKTYEQQLAELPTLPITHYNGYADGSEPLYTAEQMHDYALAAIEAAPSVGTKPEFTVSDILDLAMHSNLGVVQQGLWIAFQAHREWVLKFALALLRQSQPVHSDAKDAERPVIREIAAERERQVSAEGWSETHDDEHGDDSLLMAAICYAMPTELRQPVKPQHVVVGRVSTPYAVPIWWPESWCATWWKPKDRRRDLIRSTALIVAEIERIDRAAIATATQGSGTP